MIRCANDIFSYCSNPAQIERIEKYPQEHPDPDGKIISVMAFHVPCTLDKVSCGFLKKNSEINVECKGLGNSFKKLQFFDDDGTEIKKDKPKKKKKEEIVQGSFL